MLWLKRKLLPNLNPFRHPIKKETLDGWAKAFEDGAKVSLFTIPVVFYSSPEPIWVKVFTVIGLIFCIYWCLILTRFIREKQEIFMKVKGEER
ncbi:hypothetical protein [Actinobacillus porcinus]|uniref:hypothetical protein n=1 Tax=Actinobacillus porcinus TaxID=51048 RepID=UPI0023568751|nr:hypothetical protein [Actinobacillus porcinus]